MPRKAQLFLVYSEALAKDSESIDGSILTNTTFCGSDMWKGVEVLSDPNGGVAAGHINLINSSIIENAEIALKSFYFYQASLTAPTYLKAGGSINAQHATIKNCIIGIALGEGTYAQGAGFSQNTITDDVTFEKTQLLPIPSSMDIIFDVEEYNSVGIIGMSCGSQMDYNIDITNCTFSNLLTNSIPNQKGVGVLSNVSFNMINGNNFSKLAKGMELYGFNSSKIVSTNTFTRVDKGIIVYGKSPTIQGNFFLQIPQGINYIVGAQLVVDDTYGIRFLGAGMVQESYIQDNIFEGTPTSHNFSASYGIVVEDAWNPSEPLYLFKNTFKGVDVGIQSQLNNDGLKIKCNTFAIGAAHKISAITVFDQQANMGENCSGNSTFQAGNEFEDLCGGGTQKDIAIDFAAGGFTYWAHNYATGGSSSVSTTQPLCHTNGPVTLRVCDGVTIVPGSSPPVVYPNREKTSNSCQGALVGWLKPGNVSWGSHVLQLISDRDAIASNVLNLQALLTDPEVEKELIRKIEAEMNLLKEYNGKIADALKESGDKLAYEQFLDNTQSNESKMELAQHYMKEGNYTSAQSLLNDIELLSQPDYVFETAEEKIRYELNKKAVAELNELTIILQNENRTWLELTDVEKDDLRFMKNGFTPAAKSAEQILLLYGEAPNLHPIKKFSDDYLMALNSNKNIFNYQFSLAPNPADVQTLASYALPEWTRTAQLKVMDQYNQMGLELIDINIERNSTGFSINTTSLPAGIYLVYLLVNEEVVAGDQLMVLH